MKALALFFLFVSTLSVSVAQNPQPLDPHSLDITDHRNKDRVCMMVFGDAGRGNSQQKRVARSMLKICRSEKCDFVLGLGDNIYPTGVLHESDIGFKKRFEDIYKDFHDIDFWMLLGNHDRMGRVKPQILHSKKSSKWRMLSTHYEIPLLPDWITIYGLETQKLNENQIKEATKTFKGKMGWKILAGHHPILSNGYHGANFNMAMTLIPMIIKQKIQLYLSGHEHHQEHLETPDFHQVVQGGGGAIRRTVRRIRRFWKRNGIKQHFKKSEYGFSTIEMTREFLHLKFYSRYGRMIHDFKLLAEDFSE